MSSPSKPETEDLLKMAAYRLAGSLRPVTVPFSTPPGSVSPRIGIPSIFKRSCKTTLVVGLGNVGEKYAHTRHNIGFLVVDALAQELGARFSEKKKLRAYVASASAPEGKFVLVKPTTYMNRSGEAVQEVAAWQKPDRIIAIYDDADLPFGEIRVRESGGSAGHNGVKSLIEHLGTDTFTRVRVGIGRAANNNVALEDWVLQNWSKEEEEQVEEIVQQAAKRVQA